MPEPREGLIEERQVALVGDDQRAHGVVHILLAAQVNPFEGARHVNHTIRRDIHAQSLAEPPKQQDVVQQPPAASVRRIAWPQVARCSFACAVRTVWHETPHISARILARSSAACNVPGGNEVMSSWYFRITPMVSWMTSSVSSC